MVQLDPISLEAYLGTVFGFGIGAFYLFTSYYLYPVFFQILLSNHLPISLAPAVAYGHPFSPSPEPYNFLTSPNSIFSDSQPFSNQFIDLYPAVVSVTLMENFFNFIASLRFDYFFYCVEQMFLEFEAGLEHFDLYCRVNQSLLRFKHRIFY